MTTKPTDPEEIFKICPNHWSDQEKPLIHCNTCLALAINNLRAVVGVMYDELKELRAQTEAALNTPTARLQDMIIEQSDCPWFNRDNPGSHIHPAHLWMQRATDTVLYCPGR